MVSAFKSVYNIKRETDQYIKIQARKWRMKGSSHYSVQGNRNSLMVSNWDTGVM